ncbi:uncharacterized protein LOC119434413 [Dermacentor silvarum]|uniref:uncharacterized protein LOC119434413 n=1 Tax=Dermacentor silvarum TaxID=543639 RepID=UPI002100BADE|nr:uncharacterized protein LOC119434413 [Dermacentor silvarum]
MKVGKQHDVLQQILENRRRQVGRAGGPCVGRLEPHRPRLRAGRFFFLMTPSRQAPARKRPLPPMCLSRRPHPKYPWAQSRGRAALHDHHLGSSPKDHLGCSP